MNKFSKLRGRIVEKYGSITTFADVVGMSRVALSRKLGGKSVFTKNEIEKIMDRLGIAKDDLVEYFF